MVMVMVIVILFPNTFPTSNNIAITYTHPGLTVSHKRRRVSSREAPSHVETCHLQVTFDVGEALPSAACKLNARLLVPT